MRGLLAVLVMAAAWGAEAGAPVVVDGRVLWTVKAARAGVDAAERAREIGENLVTVAADEGKLGTDVREARLDSESILLLSRTYIFSVTEEDARLEGRTRDEVFGERKALALEAIREYRKARAWPTVLRSLAMAAGMLLVALVLATILLRVHGAVSTKLNAVLHARSQGAGLGSVYRVFEAPLTLAVRVAMGLIVYGLAAGIVISAVSASLGLFPATMGLAGAVSERVKAVVSTVAMNFIGYLPNLAVLLLVAGFTYVVVAAARMLARALEAGTIAIGGFHRDWAIPTYNLVKLLLVMFALVVAFPYLPGGESPALKGASIFVGVLVSLGSGSAMGNVVAGVILTYMRPFQVGDRVQVGETTGDVMQKTLLVTRIRTIKNVEVIVPNSAILGAHILNYSANARAQGLILNTTVTLGYDAPWRTVEELLCRAALRTPGILAEPAPFVFQTSLNDFHISYELNAYTADAARMAVLYSELHRNIQEEFNTAGVEIMSPTYLALRDGNTVTTPEANRPAGYQSPGFRVDRGPSA